MAFRLGRRNRGGERDAASHRSRETPPRATKPDVRALIDQGRLLEAIDALTERNRRVRDPRLERRLVKLRHQAFATLDRTSAIEHWPPPVDDVFAGVDGVPEVTRGELTVDAMRSGILVHGCLLVRGLLGRDAVDRLVDGIDRAFAGYDAHIDGTPLADVAPWYMPFYPGDDYELIPRDWVRAGGGVLGVDSPPTLFEFTEVLREAGVVEVFSEYLGERPALSVMKCTLRRVSPDTNTDWHQDAAFMGDRLRSVNLWLALSDCGVDAPGLDIVPRRFDLLPTGVEGAYFDWSIGRPVVERAAAGAPVVRPVFRAGDALLIDDLSVHRTAVSPEMTQQRYAIESWFFAPSAYPHDQIPIVV